jgi:hypothetical protein
MGLDRHAIARPCPMSARMTVVECPCRHTAAAVSNVAGGKVAPGRRVCSFLTSGPPGGDPSRRRNAGGVADVVDGEPLMARNTPRQVHSVAECDRSQPPGCEPLTAVVHRMTNGWSLPRERAAMSAYRRTRDVRRPCAAVAAARRPQSASPWPAGSFPGTIPGTRDTQATIREVRTPHDGG